MNISNIITGVAGVGILTGGLYLLRPDTYTHEPIKILRDTITERTQDNLSPSGESNISRILSHNPAILGDTMSKSDKLLNNNPGLKQRIQGMSWYRDFLVGNLSRDIFDQYITDAWSIEQKLIENSGMLQKIQYEEWWHRYTRGDTSPTDMLAGNISAFLTLQKIEQEQPEFYNMAKKSPPWNYGIPFGEDYIVEGQREIIISLSLRMKQLDDNPKIETELARFGFSRENLFTDDWSRSQGIYEIIDTIREIDGLSIEEKGRFLFSNPGKEYTAGKIDIKAIEKYFHGEE